MTSSSAALQGADGDTVTLKDVQSVAELFIKTIIIQGTDQGGANGCIKCPTGYISGAEQAQCNPCPAGYESNEESTKCVLCPYGSFNAKKGGKCHTCPEYTTSSYNKDGSLGHLQCELSDVFYLDDGRRIDAWRMKLEEVCYRSKHLCLLENSDTSQVLGPLMSAIVGMDEDKFFLKNNEQLSEEINFDYVKENNCEPSAIFALIKLNQITPALTLASVDEL